MPWTAGPFFAAAALVLVAGIAKLVRPAGTAAAIIAAQPPRHLERGVTRGAVEALGVAEIGAGAAALGFGNRATAALIAAAFIAFSAFAVRLLRVNRGNADCGCFGVSAAPVHPVHVGVNVVAAALAVAAAVQPPGSLLDVPGHQPWVGVPFFALTVLATYAAYLALTALTELLVIRREVESS
jgi:hypothetical protein